MAVVTHNLCVKAGEYTTHDGQQKNRWQKIGSVFRHDDGGTSIKLECMPVGLPDWEGWVSVFPREQQDMSDNAPAQTNNQQYANGQQQTNGQQYANGPQQQQRRAAAAPQRRQRQQQTKAPPIEFDDDIPF